MGNKRARTAAKKRSRQRRKEGRVGGSLRCVAL